MPEENLPNQNLNQQDTVLQNKKDNSKIRNKKFHLSYLIIVILILFIGFSIGYIFKNTIGGLPLLTYIKHLNSKSCTLEARICPDGVTTVGRTGPNCEFATCPETKTINTSDWKTENIPEYGFSFQYPANMYATKTVMAIKDPAIQILLTPNKIGSQPLINIDIHPYQVNLDKYKKSEENSGFYYNATTKNTVINNNDVLIITKNYYTPTGGMPNNGTGYTVATNIGKNSITINGDIDQKKLIDDIISTLKITDTTSQSSTQNYLEVPEFGVKIPLTENNEDAYYTSPIKTEGNARWVYLKVHSLDSEAYCNDGNKTGLAALSRVPKDEIDQRTGKKYSDSGIGALIGNYYYYMEGSQAACAQKPSNLTIEQNARGAFMNASQDILKL